MPILLDRINWGCSTSQWFVDLAEESKVLLRGRQIVLELWPFIRELPLNISAVRDRLPERMVAAGNLLRQLSDDERYYQDLFRKQFALAGLSETEVESYPIPRATARLCEVMRHYCRSSSFEDGIHAIVTAELAATMYCRSSLPAYESYFGRHKDNYSPTLIEDGLAWLRLHAKTHTRHAIWMKRMLGELDGFSGNDIPPAAEAVLGGLLTLWGSNAEPALEESSLAAQGALVRV